MRMEKLNRTGVAPERLQLQRESLVEGRGPLPHVCLLRCGGRAHLDRCRRGLRDEDQRKQANDYGSQNGYLLNGDRGAARTDAARVARCANGSERVTSRVVATYKSLRIDVTNVTVSDNGARLRGRDSNPNFLVQSQASCR